MNDILKRLKSGEILLSDGAWGTLLQDMGLQTGNCPEQWNLTNPEKVKAVASAYVQAGSNIVLTNTFGGSSFKLASYDLQSKTKEINRMGAALSKEVAGDKVFVAASVGPTGKFLQPLGDVSEQEMYEVFCEQISAQAEGGADAIIIETMSDSGEAALAVKAAKEVTTLPVIATMTFEHGKQGYRTMMGVSIEQAVRSLTDSGADIVGTNCGNGIEQMCEIISQMRNYTSKFLIAHPNAGLPKLIDNKTVFDQSPEEMARYVTDLIEAGANIIGGCCGTTPKHIKEMAQQISNQQID
jgi:5-methyltetrahydrofolate--homocysteine methyltransferase